MTWWWVVMVAAVIVGCTIGMMLGHRLNTWLDRRDERRRG